MPTTFTVKTRNVNSKRLLATVTEFMQTVITEFSILWDSDTHRDAIIEVIEEFLEELAEDGKITQFNVICDGRNNTKQLRDSGMVNLDITFKQEDCYNTTSLHYVVIHGSQDS